MNIERAILFWSGNCLRIFCIRSHIFCWTDILRHGSYATSQLNSRTNQNRLVPVWFRTQLSVLCYAYVKFRPHPIFPHLGRTKIRRSHDLTKFNSIIFCFSIHILPKDHMQEPLPYVTISDRSNKLLSLGYNGAYCGQNRVFGHFSPLALSSNCTDCLAVIFVVNCF